jgi:hypothetical protein
VDECCEYTYQGLRRKAITFQTFLLRVNFFSLFQEQKPEDNQDDAVDPEGDEGVRFDKLEQKFDGQQSHDKGRGEANQGILNLVEGKL